MTEEGSRERYRRYCPNCDVRGYVYCRARSMSICMNEDCGVVVYEL